MFQPQVFFEAGKARSGTALIPFFDSTSVAFGISTRNGNTVVDWGDGSSTNIAPVKMRDYADGSALSSNFNKSYSSALNGNVSVKFLRGLKDIYSIFLGIFHDTNQKSKLNILDVETFFKQFPNLFSLCIDEYAYQTTARMSVIKGDLAKLPNSVERVLIRDLEVINATTDFILNFSNYTNSSNLKYLNSNSIYTAFKIFGDLGTLPTSCQHLYLLKASEGSSITYTAGKVWASSFDTLYLPLALTPSQNDSLLIDAYNSITTAIGGKLFDLKGFRSSASDIAVAGLIAKGFTVNCQKGSIILDLPLQNNFTDYSASGISMVAANANGLPSFISDGSGGFALDFNGTKSIKTAVNLPINTSNKVSIEFEVKSSSSSDGWIVELGPSIDAGEGFLCVYRPTQSAVQCWDKKTGYNSVNSPISGFSSWKKVVMIIDRSLGVNQNKIYVDGVLNSTQNPSFITDNNGNFTLQTLFIGQRNGSSLGFIGQIKNLKIYNYPIL